MTTHTRTVGKSNTTKESNARWIIYKALCDNKWHRNIELKEKTKLSPITLQKHLKYMVDFKIVEKKTSVENGKYAVLFKATTDLMIFLNAFATTMLTIDSLKPALAEMKDPLLILEIIHIHSQIYFLKLLERIQKQKHHR